MRAGKSLPEIFILREKARQWRHPRNGNRTIASLQMNRNLVFQRSHLPHVLLVVHGVESRCPIQGTTGL